MQSTGSCGAPASLLVRICLSVAGAWCLTTAPEVATAQKTIPAERAARKQVAKPAVATKTTDAAKKKEPAKKEPAKKEPAKKEPAKKEPAKKEPAKKEPAKKEPAKKEPAKKEPAKKELAKKEPAKKEPARKAATGAKATTKTEDSQTKPVVIKDPVVARIIATGRNGNQVMGHLDHLTNRIGPRLSGSDGLHRACLWARDTMQEMGLRGARLERWGEFPVGFNRGPWSGRMVEPQSKSLTFATNAWTAGTKGRQFGPSVLAPETVEELAKMKDQLKNAWVLVKRPARRSRKDYQNYQKMLAGLQQFEIAGVVRPTSDERIVTGGNYRLEWAKLPKTPNVILIREQWEEIAKLLKEGKAVKLEFDIRNYFFKGPVPLYNVIADIPGTTWPDQYVVVGGHIDSWDAATGATDNGAGCATTLEAARILRKAGVKPKRTIRFMLWSGEEQGLLGSRAYVKANPDIVSRVSAVLVHDGGTNYVSGIGCPENMLPDMHQVFAAAKTLDPRTPFKVEKIEVLRPLLGSDHASFTRAGAPGFFWRQAGRAVYRQTHHTQFDTYDTVVPEYQKHSSIVIALGAYGLANLDHLLPRDKVRSR